MRPKCKALMWGWGRWRGIEVRIIYIGSMLCLKGTKFYAVDLCWFVYSGAYYFRATPRRAVPCNIGIVKIFIIAFLPLSLPYIHLALRVILAQLQWNEKSANLSISVMMNRIWCKYSLYNSCLMTILTWRMIEMYEYVLRNKPISNLKLIKLLLLPVLVSVTTFKNIHFFKWPKLRVQFDPCMM